MSDSTFDLDAEIEKLDVSPKLFKLGGEQFELRRDLSGAEVVRYWELVRSQEDAKALSILVGDEAGAQLNDILTTLPRVRMVAASQKLMKLAGLMSEEESGE